MFKSLDDENAFLSYSITLTTTTSFNNSSDPEHDQREKTNSTRQIDEKSIKCWLARHIWNFLYALELPLKFSGNKYFNMVPSIKINANMEIPKISKSDFLSLNHDTLKRFISEILLFGVENKKINKWNNENDNNSSRVVKENLGTWYRFGMLKITN